jgi:hypothetical protein
MMPSVVYLLCAATSLACMVMLVRGYLRSRARLLLWSGLCFACFFLNNLLLFVDMIMVPDADLSMYRALVSLAGIGLLLYGLIWDSGRTGAR